MQAQPTEKTCRGCGKTKPTSDYRTRRNGRVEAQCRKCERAVERARRGTDEWRAQRRERYAANREDQVKKMREYRERNPEFRIRTRLVREGGRGLPVEREAMEYGCVLLSDPCSYCGGPAGRLDHITPISNGGTHDWANLTAACHSCNARKQSLSLLDALIRGTMVAEMENWATRWEQAA